MAMHGKKDWLYPHKTGEKAIQLIPDVYNKAGAGQKFVSEFYEVHHEFAKKCRIGHIRGWTAS